MVRSLAGYRNIAESLEINKITSPKRLSLFETRFSSFMWVNKKVEEAWKTAVSGVEVGWDDDLAKIGALGVREEHVDLFCVTSGRHHRQDQ